MAKKVIYKRAEIAIDLHISLIRIAARFPDLNAKPPELPLCVAVEIGALTLIDVVELGEQDIPSFDGSQVFCDLIGAWIGVAIEA